MTVESGYIAWINCDGGRHREGFPPTSGGCAIRAIAIATEMTYKDARELIKQFVDAEVPPKRGRPSILDSWTRHDTFKKIMESIGWKWTPTMRVGQGCTVHLHPDELPKGRIICQVSKHWCAVVNGTIYDLADPSRNGKRCVYGYWSKP